MNIYTMPKVTTEDFRVANYLIDHDCDFIGIEENLSSMILRGENIESLVCRAERETLSPLTESEESRLFSMLSLFTIDKRMELEEEGDL